MRKLEGLREIRSDRATPPARLCAERKLSGAGENKEKLARRAEPSFWITVADQKRLER